MDKHPGPGPITVADIPEDEWPAPERRPVPWYDEAFERAIYRALSSGIGLKEIGRTAEQVAVSIAVNEENGSLQKAAIRLGVSDRALQIRRANGGRGLRSH